MDALAQVLSRAEPTALNGTSAVTPRGRPTALPAWAGTTSMSCNAHSCASGNLTHPSQLGNVPGTTGISMACVSLILSPRQQRWLGKQRQQTRGGWAHTKMFSVFTAAQPLAVQQGWQGCSAQTHPRAAEQWAHGNFTHWDFTVLGEMKWGAEMAWERLRGSLWLVSAEFEGS